jgi:hypothetical protein
VNGAPTRAASEARPPRETPASGNLRHRPPRRHGPPAASTGSARARAAPTACFRTQSPEPAQSQQTRRGGRARLPSHRRVDVSPRASPLAISLVSPLAATGFVTFRHGTSGTTSVSVSVTSLRDVLTMRRGGMSGARSDRGRQVAGRGARAHARRRAHAHLRGAAVRGRRRDAARRRRARAGAA